MGKKQSQAARPGTPKRRDPLPGQPLLIPLPCDGCKRETRIFLEIYGDGTRLCHWCVAAVQQANKESRERVYMQANPDPPGCQCEDCLPF